MSLFIAVWSQVIGICTSATAPDLPDGSYVTDPVGGAYEVDPANGAYTIDPGV